MSAGAGPLHDYAPRRQTSLLDELRTVVEEEGTTINQSINVAVAENLAALRTDRCFRGRPSRANRADFLTILDKAGTDATIAPAAPTRPGYAGRAPGRRGRW